jgi:AbrB family looped-hinge helix DNA binding protein
MRITEKGQITIPIRMRERTGLLPGGEVEFEERPDGVFVRRAQGKVGARGKEAIDRLAGSSRSGLSTDELLALTRN